MSHFIELLLDLGPDHDADVVVMKMTGRTEEVQELLLFPRDTVMKTNTSQEKTDVAWRQTVDDLADQFMPFLGNSLGLFLDQSFVVDVGFGSFFIFLQTKVIQLLVDIIKFLLLLFLDFKSDWSGGIAGVMVVRGLVAGQVATLVAGLSKVIFIVVSGSDALSPDAVGLHQSVFLMETHLKKKINNCITSTKALLFEANAGNLGRISNLLFQTFN